MHDTRTAPLEYALDRWRDWHATLHVRPRSVRELAAGHTNRSYLVAAGDTSFVVRVDSAAAALLRIDRAREIAIHALAADAGIAPGVVFHDAHAGVFVTTFIDAPPLAAGTANATKDARLIALTRRIHALAGDVGIEDYYVHAEAYWQALAARGVHLPDALHETRARIARERDRHGVGTAVPAVCHRDLSPGNILDHGDELTVLDWEYACRGWAAFDYAALAVEWSVPTTDIERAFGITPAALAHAIDLYRYTCDLWWRLPRA